MIIVRPFVKQIDYEEVARWWVAQGWPALPPESLPFGYVGVHEELGKMNTLAAAAFLYSTEATLHIMEWIVGNPQLAFTFRGEAIEAVVLACCRRAKELGGLSVITTTKHERLIERYRNMGFKTADEGMTHLVIDLGKIKQ